MTVPNERLRAVIQTREFLLKLLNPQETPRVPKKIRRQAGNCLKHYPHVFDMCEVAKKDKTGVFK